MGDIKWRPCDPKQCKWQWNVCLIAAASTTSIFHTKCGCWHLHFISGHFFHHRCWQRSETKAFERSLFQACVRLTERERRVLACDVRRMAGWRDCVRVPAWSSGPRAAHSAQAGMQRGRPGTLNEVSPEERENTFYPSLFVIWDYSGRAIEWLYACLNNSCLFHFQQFFCLFLFG